MRPAAPAFLISIALALPGSADSPPLLPEPVVAALASELSGAEAKRTAQELSLHHRQRGSRGFAAAAEAIRRRAAGYGLSQVEILELPADGEIFYGTQRSRPGWDADFAELWEVAEADGEIRRLRRLASYAERPITLAQDSASGRVTAELVDVGAGTAEADYAGKEVAGKLVLVAAQPGAAAPLAVGRFGAAGLVSYAQNQRTAWWQEDENLVRWGHLETFPAPATFAFMVSLKEARSFKERLARGERVLLAAEVEAGQHAGSYAIPTAVIPGADPAVAGEEIVFSCHLDHQRPGANDNASGCAAILEAGRALAKLVGEGRIPSPRRTLRFIWPPEIEGTIALVNARPELAARARAVIHMDMVGGDPAVTKAVFHVTRSPASLPTFVDDVAEALGRFVNHQSEEHAAGRSARYPLVDPEGGKEALLAQIADFSMGSDHQVWTEGSLRVPAIYLNDWPDRYIHTHADAIANLDATKLLRAAFLGAASGYLLANLTPADLPALTDLLRRHALERTARALEKAAELPALEAADLLRFHFATERATLDSLAAFLKIPFDTEALARTRDFLDGLARLAGAMDGDDPKAAATPADGARIYRRRHKPRGPMSGFGYSYLEDHLQKAGLKTPALLSFEARWGGGGELAYEALNLVDGTRTAAQVRDDLAAIYGPLPLELVVEYLEALVAIGVLEELDAS